MSIIAFIDTEITSTHIIADIGCVTSHGKKYHGPSVITCIDLLKECDFVCGHNVVHHDLKYLKPALTKDGNVSLKVIDTLYLSPLLFPNRPYHRLLKDDKLQTDELNNPLHDAKKARDLFNDECAKFFQLEESLQQIYCLLLRDKLEFSGFFAYLNLSVPAIDLEQTIVSTFSEKICSDAPVDRFIEDYPVELAFALALIQATDRYSVTPPWVLKNFPKVERVMYLLRNKPCVMGCDYCDEQLDTQKALSHFFGHDRYRLYHGENLQERAVKAAVENKSLIAIFPTGGGKSITFQVPALMSGRNEKGLTVVISPLQSLMKDQVDNLEKNGITEAVTINGLLDPIERAKSFERVADGSAYLLYISPEMLRSRTIERLLLGRKIVRFVIDEAHCFSAWGQDFRIDYLYIGDFIRMLEEKKNLSEKIPVSCFTATAKPKVIEDICAYFSEKLELSLTVFKTPVKRENLRYKVSKKDTDEEKYATLRSLIEAKNCPTIVYVSRTKRADKIAEQLNRDGFLTRSFHGKMDSRQKTTNQNAFLNGEIPIMVATSAFGMGVDKKDVGLVVHFDISDSLENYVQEAGRAGRDEHLQADCHILFNEEDLGKHFIMLNQTKLSIKEIQQIWRAIKNITKVRSTVSQSALEIARKAGWDDTVVEIETRVRTAIAALEQAGYLKRGQNIPRVFANSIVPKNVDEAREKIYASSRFDDPQKENALRIIKKMISTKNRKETSDEIPESRIDYISDHLGIPRQEVINLVTILREENVLSDAQDLSSFIKKSENKNRSLAILENYQKIELFLLPKLEMNEKILNLKELNESAAAIGNVTPAKLKTILNFWAIKHWIKRSNSPKSPHLVATILNESSAVLMEKLEMRHQLSAFILELLFAKSANVSAEKAGNAEEVMVNFSVLELKSAYQNSSNLFRKNPSIHDVEDALFYLSRIEALKIEGGFMVVYNQMTVERLEKNDRINYKADDYKTLKQFYENKIEQIHIVGEYALKMIDQYENALLFVDDYFQLNYSSFLDKHFPKSRQNDIKRTITPAKFKQLFGDLSETQLSIIKDQDSKNSCVIAGPGSGKTRVLVHKLASLLLLEDVKHEQLLMLTFSRAAATEFRQRLKALIGNATNFIAIKTFHSFCFDLSGKIGSLTKSDNIVQNTVLRIQQDEVEKSAITKTVLVVDEGQDMNEHEYALLLALMEQNEDLRVLIVGDDDQAIYEFRDGSAKYLQQFVIEHGALKTELVRNYRSKQNLVEFANQFITCLPNRLKTTPISASQLENGKIRLIQHQSAHLILSMVEEVLRSHLSGSTALLTHSNEEANLLASLLTKKGKKIKLIQGNDGFNLYDLHEIRLFVDWIEHHEQAMTIDAEIWSNAKAHVARNFAKSPHFEIINGLIRVFEQLYPETKYKSDLIALIRESMMENFYSTLTDTIHISTIHKAKGREYDNVFLLLENFHKSLAMDVNKRLLYVGLTRAISNLTICTNGTFLNHIEVEELERIEATESYPAPTELIEQLVLKDLHLDTFLNKSHIIDSFVSGDPLEVFNQQITYQGQTFFRFSKEYTAHLKVLNDKGYFITEARVNFVVHWKKTKELDDTKTKEHPEIRVLLPQLILKRRIE